MTAAPRDILADLVAFPTVAGTPNGELIDYAAQRLSDDGARVTIHRAHRDDGVNLHAVLGPGDAPGGVVLSGHTDVVPVDGQPWSHDPFTLHAEGERLYGRGTADMKGFIAAVLGVCGETAAERLRAPLHVVLSCDEELGCLGIRPLLPTLAGAVVAPRRCIVGEPTRLRTATRHKGKLALRITVTGRATHSGHAPEGVNAVEYAARLIVALQDVAEPDRDERFAVPYATVSTGPIHGGLSLNIVPDRCVFEVEVRLLPGQDTEATEGRVRSAAGALEATMHAIAPEAGIAVERLTAYPGLAGTGDGLALDFGTEAGLLQQALGEATVVVCGPGDMAQGHKPDEFIEEAQLTGAVDFLRREVAALT